MHAHKYLNPGIIDSPLVYIALASTPDRIFTRLLVFSVHIRCKVRFGPIHLPGRHFALAAVYSKVNALAKALTASYKLIVK